jgi:hypothetical protein
MVADRVCSGNSEPLFVKAFRNPHDHDRLGCAVQDLVGRSAEHCISYHGVAMRAHDDQVNSVFLGGRQDGLSRLALFNPDLADPMFALLVSATFLFV